MDQLLHPTRILGLDPGLRVTGYAVLDPGPIVLDAGVFRSEVTDLPGRVKSLYDDLCGVLDQWQPGVLVIEQLYAHYDHPRTAVLMAHARGGFLLAGAQRGLEVLSYPATTVKKTVTGYGRATKEQMQAAVMRELRLPKLPTPHDVADALAIALCHAYHQTSSFGLRPSAVITTTVNRAMLRDDPDPQDD